MKKMTLIYSLMIVIMLVFVAIPHDSNIVYGMIRGLLAGAFIQLIPVWVRIKNENGNS